MMVRIKGEGTAGDLKQNYTPLICFECEDGCLKVGVKVIKVTYKAYK